jgi:hypothetical protein
LDFVEQVEHSMGSSERESEFVEVAERDSSEVALDRRLARNEEWIFVGGSRQIMVPARAKKVPLAVVSRNE